MSYSIVFSPEAQDQAALHLIEERGALNRFDQNGLCAEVLARLAPAAPVDTPKVGVELAHTPPVLGEAAVAAMSDADIEALLLDRLGKP